MSLAYLRSSLGLLALLALGIAHGAVRGRGPTPCSKRASKVVARVKLLVQRSRTPDQAIRNVQTL